MCPGLRGPAAGFLCRGHFRQPLPGPLQAEPLVSRGTPAAGSRRGSCGRRRRGRRRSCSGGFPGPPASSAAACGTSARRARPADRPANRNGRWAAARKTVSGTPGRSAGIPAAGAAAHARHPQSRAGSRARSGDWAAWSGTAFHSARNGGGISRPGLWQIRQGQRGHGDVRIGLGRRDAIRLPAKALIAATVGGNSRPHRSQVRGFQAAWIAAERSVCRRRSLHCAEQQSWARV